MIKLKKMRKFNLLWIISFALLVLSCSEEESFDHEIIDMEGRALLTNCNIPGNSCGSPGGTTTLTYSSDFSPNDINWSIQSGNISILNGQGTNTVTLQLGSNFNGGSVYAIGSGNGGIVCSDSYSIPKCPTCNLSLGGELENGQYMAFSPTLNRVSNNVTYRTDMWVSPSDASVSWARIYPFSSSVSWSQTGIDLSFRFNDNGPFDTGGQAKFRMTVSKNGCTSLTRDFIFCHGDCSVNINPDI